MTEEKKTIEISYVPDDEDIEEKEEEKKEKAPTKTAKKKGPTAKELQEQLKEQEEILKRVLAERDENKDNYLRTLAEMDNFRKRIQKDKEDYQRYALSEFLLDLLQVYDNLDRALKAASNSNQSQGDGPLPENEQSIISGVEMIYKQFSDLLKKYNVKEIEALDKPFDPNLHQALTKEEREDIEDPLVVEVYQKGFLYNDKLLKPTLARVAVPAESGAKDQEEEKE